MIKPLIMRRTVSGSLNLTAIGKPIESQNFDDLSGELGKRLLHIQDKRIAFHPTGPYHLPS
jgi:hypothetical protein